MRLHLRFNLNSFIVFLIIFIVEILIALFVDDKIIRPYGGDVLVVIMIYYFVKSFLDIRPLYLAIGVVLFAYLVEFGQYLRLLEVLDIQDNTLLRIVLGSSFSWMDMLAYTLGGLICHLVDRKVAAK